MIRTVYVHKYIPKLLTDYYYTYIYIYIYLSINNDLPIMYLNKYLYTNIYIYIHKYIHTYGTGIAQSV